MENNHPRRTAKKPGAKPDVASSLWLERIGAQRRLHHVLKLPVNRAQSPLDAPVVLGIDNGTSTQFIVRAQPVANAKSYEAQVKNGGGWLPAGVFTQARRMEIDNLTPGSIYTVHVRAIGGSTGSSDWSTPQTCMAT